MRFYHLFSIAALACTATPAAAFDILKPDVITIYDAVVHAEYSRPTKRNYDCGFELNQNKDGYYVTPVSEVDMLTQFMGKKTPAITFKKLLTFSDDPKFIFVGFTASTIDRQNPGRIHITLAREVNERGSYYMGELPIGTEARLCRQMQGQPNNCQAEDPGVMDGMFVRGKINDMNKKCGQLIRAIKNEIFKEGITIDNNHAALRKEKAARSTAYYRLKNVGASAGELSP